MSNILIAGCGKLGRKVALQEIAQGNQVYGLVSSQASAKQNASLKIEPCVYDLDTGAGDLDALLCKVSFDYLYYFAPPPSTGNQDPRLKRFLALLDNTNHTALNSLLISTTGVYGHCHGDWVDESRVPAPTVDRAKRRLHAEHQWLHWMKKHKAHSVILRVPGIYSADRLPATRLIAKKPVLALEESPYSNRIHEHDLVAIAIKAIRAGFSSEIFNVSDDEPTTMTEYFFKVADVLGLERPPEISHEQATKEMSSGMMSYLDESRRISNKKLKQMLGIELKYPTLDQGLVE